MILFSCANLEYWAYMFYVIFLAPFFFHYLLKHLDKASDRKFNKIRYCKDCAFYKADTCRCYLVYMELSYGSTICKYTDSYFSQTSRETIYLSVDNVFPISKKGG